MATRLGLTARSASLRG